MAWTAGMAVPLSMQPDPVVALAGPVGQSQRTVVAGLTARAAARSGCVWGIVFGITIASSAISYRTLYPSQAQRNALATAFGANRATIALFGPAPRLETVAGFTAFKASMVLMILGAVWGLLTSTRLLRGEEEAGRWELLLSGQTTARSATAQALAGLGAGVVVLWGLTALGTVLGGRGPKASFGLGPSLYFALAMVSTAVVFAAVGGVTSQLAATRRQAAATAAIALGVSYAIRMVADAGVGLHGLIWASPLGWVEELGALTDPRPIALLPIAALSAALATAASLLAGRRDTGASLVPDRTAAPPRLALLGGPTGLAVRLTRPTVIGWWAAIAISGLLYGLIAKSAGGTVTGSSVHEVFSRLGSPGTGAEAVLGVAFLVLAVLVSFVAAGQLTAARSPRHRRPGARPGSPGYLNRRLRLPDLVSPGGSRRRHRCHQPLGPRHVGLPSDGVRTGRPGRLVSRWGHGRAGFGADGRRPRRPSPSRPCGGLTESTCAANAVASPADTLDHGPTDDI